jgi:hypothetical protein
MKNLLFLSFILTLVIAGCNGSDSKKTETNSSQLQGAYMGQELPGQVPALFAPGVISTGMYERDMAISPDGKEIYYTIMGGNFSVIACTKEVDGKWTTPELAPFSGSTTFLDAEPHISPDGQRFYFLSTRPQEGQEPMPGWSYQDIWVMDRTDEGWGDPYNLGPPVNTDAGEFFPSSTLDGTLYFTREVGEQQQAIFRSRLVEGAYQESERLPDHVNPGSLGFNACISPGEEYLILCSPHPDGIIGRVDYWASFRSEDDQWSPLINLGEGPNTRASMAISPYITPDGAYFIFSSNRGKALGDTLTHSMTMQDLIDARTLPMNGNSDLYWVSSSVITQLKPTSAE